MECISTECPEGKCVFWRIEDALVRETHYSYFCLFFFFTLQTISFMSSFKVCIVTGMRLKIEVGQQWVLVENSQCSRSLREKWPKYIQTTKHPRISSNVIREKQMKTCYSVVSCGTTFYWKRYQSVRTSEWMISKGRTSHSWDRCCAWPLYPSSSVSCASLTVHWGRDDLDLQNVNKLFSHNSLNDSCVLWRQSSPRFRNHLVKFSPLREWHQENVFLRGKYLSIRELNHRYQHEHSLTEWLETPGWLLLRCWQQKLQQNRDRLSAFMQLALGEPLRASHGLENKGHTQPRLWFCPTTAGRR